MKEKKDETPKDTGENGQKPNIQTPKIRTFVVRTVENDGKLETQISLDGFTSPEEVVGFIQLRMNPQNLINQLLHEWTKPKV